MGFFSNEIQALPSDILYTPDGQEVDLATLKGKVHFITFWALWCQPCLEEKPQLQELKSRFSHQDNIEFIDIYFNTNKTAWINVIETEKSDGIQLWSQDLQAKSRKLNFSGIPMHLTVDAEGNYKSYRSLDVIGEVLLEEY